MANFASWNASPSMGNAIYNKVYNNKVKMNGKIIIACDSYKGCLTSREVNEAIASGIKECDSEETASGIDKLDSNEASPEIICLEMSDGGEGMLDAFLTAMKGERV